MRAAWYERQGDPAEVLEIGEMAMSAPAAGEVAVRLTRSGINPGDLKKRSPWLSNPMAFPRIVPHSDGAGVVEAVGDGVDPSRIGRRVWVYGAQSYRAFGTAADGTVVPDRLAVDLPDEVGDEIGASLGIPGITAHRAVFADGPVRDQVVLVHGVRGGVSSLAAQLARWAGAQVIGTVRTAAEIGLVDPASAEHVVALDADPDRRSCGWRPARSCGSSRSRSRLTSIWTPPSRPKVPSSPATPPRMADRRFRSGRCCSTT